MRLLGLFTDFARTGPSERSLLLERGVLGAMMSMCLGNESDYPELVASPIARRKRRPLKGRGDAEPPQTSPSHAYDPSPMDVSDDGVGAVDNESGMDTAVAASTGRRGGMNGESLARRGAGAGVGMDVVSNDKSKAPGYDLASKELRQVQRCSINQCVLWWICQGRDVFSCIQATCAIGSVALRTGRCQGH